MKKLTIIAAVLFSFAATALPPAQKLELPEGSHHPVLSPDGNTLLFSTIDHTGLKALDLSTQEIQTIDPAMGAGFQPIFSLDGSKVFYRTAQVCDGLNMRDIRSFTLNTGEEPELLRPLNRETIDIRSFAGGDYAIDNYRTIRVVSNGQTREIEPLADAYSYMWSSLSPDGSRLLFTEPFTGVYVSNTDGTNPVCLLPKGDYATWAGDNKFIAVVTRDDGYVVTKSTLVLVHTGTGIVTELTPENVLVGEATASASGIVIYSDLNGNMFMLDLNNL